jgi:hypothetical protein
MHLYIIALRRGFPKWISEPVTRKTDNIMYKSEYNNKKKNNQQKTKAKTKHNNKKKSTNKQS